MYKGSFNNYVTFEGREGYARRDTFDRGERGVVSSVTSRI